jgi:hypothetical protein
MRTTWIATAGLAGMITLATAAMAQPGTRPVRVGTGGSDLSVCAYGEVRGLNPRGDNFLSVRVAPRANAREIDRLREGRRVWLCDGKSVPGWTGIVYATRRGQECHVGIPARRPRHYGGSCRQGWVSSRYVTATAG